MSGLLLLIVGALLCFAGLAFLRVGIVLAGLAAGCFLAEAFDASLGVALLTACAGALAAFLGARLLARFMFFIGGGCVGVIAGIKLFVLADRGQHDWLLAVIVVAAVGLLGGFLANRWRRPFLSWGAAFTGAALVLSGLGRMSASVFGSLWRPQTVFGSLVLAAAWIVLTVVGRGVQTSRLVRKHEADKPPVAH